MVASPGVQSGSVGGGRTSRRGYYTHPPPRTSTTGDWYPDDVFVRAQDTDHDNDTDPDYMCLFGSMLEYPQDLVAILRRYLRTPYVSNGVLTSSPGPRSVADSMYVVHSLTTPAGPQYASLVDLLEGEARGTDAGDVVSIVGTTGSGEYHRLHGRDWEDGGGLVVGID